MFSKTNLMSTLVTTIWGFFGGYLLWGLIGDPILKDHTVSSGLMKDPPDFMHLVIGCLIVGFVVSTIYSKWARGAHSMSQGAQYGIWLGILMGLGSGMIDFATSNLLDLSGTLINAVVYIVHFGIMGVFVSLIYGKMKSED
ncbi:hypothetical protein A9Q87_02720 [Flavobacteriales bacterium 34_180_T64]|nr:hypothetical protein A9Q87_02720 [Flavobacteriales bacterium 34_180_T64]